MYRYRAVAHSVTRMASMIDVVTRGSGVAIRALRVHNYSFGMRMRNNIDDKQGEFAVSVRVCEQAAMVYSS